MNLNQYNKYVNPTVFKIVLLLYYFKLDGINYSRGIIDNITRLK